MALPGVSTLGITLSYASEATAGTKPTTGWKKLSRINSIGGIGLDIERIDASALEDSVSSYVAGRADTGGQLPITVNLTDSTIQEWQDVITAYNGLSGGKQMWFQVLSPSLAKSFFIIAQPPQQIPMPEANQNELFTVEINLTIVEYKGLDTKVQPTA